MKNTLIKVLCVLLAGLMLLPLVSCVGNDDDTTTTTKGEETTTGGNNSSEKVDLPAKDYNGDEIVFLTLDAGAVWGGSALYPSSGSNGKEPTLNGEAINDAVYNRNETLKKRYNIEISQMTTMDIIDTLNKGKAGTDEYEASEMRLFDGVTASTRGYLWDLKDSERFQYIDFSKSWWDQNSTEDLSIDGKLYLATGDICYEDDNVTFCMYFNKTLHKEYDMPSFYKMVSDYEWTLDEFAKYGEMVIKDDGGDGKFVYGSGDIIGYAGNDNTYIAHLFASGITVAQKNAITDIPEWSLDVERLADVLEPIVKSCTSKYNTFQAQDMREGGSQDVVANGMQVFGQGKSLFFGETVGASIGYRTQNVIFGMLPYPMYEKSQEEYISYMNTFGHVVAIPKTTNGDRTERIDILFEAFAAESQKTVTPAYYERVLKGQSTHDEESRPMIDVILAGRIYDFGYIYGWGNTVTNIVSTIAKGSTSVSAQIKKGQRLFDAEMKEDLKGLGIELG